MGCDSFIVCAGDFCTGLLAVVSSVQAADRYWNASAGDWSVATNRWNGLAPGMYDRANIDNGGCAELTAGVVTIFNFVVGRTSANCSVLRQRGGTLNVTGAGTTSFGVGGYWDADAAATGLCELRGGKIVVSNYSQIGRFIGSTGVLDVVDGAFTQTHESKFFNVGEDGHGTLNVGSAGTVTGRGILIASTQTAGNKTSWGEVNVAPGGTLNVGWINGGANPAAGHKVLNVDGRTSLRGRLVMDVRADGSCDRLMCTNGTLDLSGLVLELSPDSTLGAAACYLLATFPAGMSGVVGETAFAANARVSRGWAVRVSSERGEVTLSPGGFMVILR